MSTRLFVVLVIRIEIVIVNLFDGHCDVANSIHILILAAAFDLHSYNIRLYLGSVQLIIIIIIINIIIIIIIINSFKSKVLFTKIISQR